MAPQLSLTVLVDNNTITDHYFSGEPGLSFLITTQGKKILFDTGYSDLFLKNAQGLGEDLLDLDMVVFSHGHLDHTGGLPDLVRHLTRAIIEEIPVRIPTVIAHPFAFTRVLNCRFRISDQWYPKKNCEDIFRWSYQQVPDGLPTTLLF